MKNERGFTAVELIITLILGLMMLITAYQLYTFVMNDSSATRLRASASNLAYEFMREGSAAATNPCTASSSSPLIPTGPGGPQLPSDATASVQITCPPSNLPNSMSYITSTITYGGNTVTHATYLSPN